MFKAFIGWFENKKSIFVFGTFVLLVTTLFNKLPKLLFKLVLPVYLVFPFIVLVVLLKLPALDLRWYAAKPGALFWVALGS